MTKVAPSILSADFAKLGEDILRVEKAGADYLHVDVMDGMFVPNISLGIPVIKSARKVTDMIFDVHLMIDKPIRYIEEFSKAGADIITIHVESDTPENTTLALRKIKSLGKKAGLSLKPGTPASVLEKYISYLDMVLIMTVEPGFGGQSFMFDQIEKIRKVQDMIERAGIECEIEVDGGINKKTAELCRLAGANVLVAGSFVFRAEDIMQAVKDIRGDDGEQVV